MEKQSFEHKTQQLIDSYTSIPIKATINLFIRTCFMHGTTNNEFYYKNLKESDREFAYFSLKKSNEAKEYYYSRFPNSKKDTLLTYEMFDMTPNKFEDIKVSVLSIEILNFIYFECFLSKQVNVFKDSFNSLVDDCSESKTHQLLALENRFDKIMVLRGNFTSDEPKIKGIDYLKFYDLIDESQKAINEFIKSKFRFIRANNKDITLISKKGREQNLLKIIDEADLTLFYLFEEWLIKEEYLDEEKLSWIASGGKSSFSRLYLKLDKHNLIKKGGGRKRKDKIRLLSDIYKIDGVTKYDYTPGNCQKAILKDSNEFRELDHIKSQFNLNSENN